MINCFLFIQHFINGGLSKDGIKSQAFPLLLSTGKKKTCLQAVKRNLISLIDVVLKHDKKAKLNLDGVRKLECFRNS
jgi:hypothetical protein